jgi:hypothetical protein
MPNMMNELVSASRKTALLLVFVSSFVGMDEAYAQAPGEEEDTKPRVLLLPTQRQEGVSEVVPGRVDRYLKQLLDISDQATFFTLETLEAPVVDRKVEIPVEDPKLKKADNLLWDAKELVGKSKFYKAAAAFKKSMKLYESRFDVLVDFNKYIDAALGVSLAYFYAGQAFEAERALKRVLSFRPDLILDKRKVPKEALSILSRLQQQQTSAALTQVNIESKPPGAEVFIDGIRAGMTPFIARNMVRGVHVVRLVQEGYSSYAKSISLSGKGHVIRAKLKPLKSRAEAAPAFRSPEPLVTLVQQGKLGPRFLRIAAQVSRFYDIDNIVMGYARKNKGRYEMATFVWERGSNRTAELDWISLDPELSDMQVNLLNLESQVLSGLAAFPVSRKLSGVSDIYVNVEARRRAAEQKAQEAQRRSLQIQIVREAREAEQAAKAREKQRIQRALLEQREARKSAKAAVAAAALQERIRQRDAKLALVEAAKQERARKRNAKLAAKQAAKQARIDARTARLQAERVDREARVRRTAKENREHDLRVAAEARRAKRDREARERQVAHDRRRDQQERAARRPPTAASETDEVARLIELERRAHAESARLAEARRQAETRQRESLRKRESLRQRETRDREARDREARDREAREREAREEATRDRQVAEVEPLAPVKSSSALDWMNEQDDEAIAPYDGSGVWYKKWWFWAGTGAVVAVIGGTLIFSGDEAPEGFRASASW